MSAEGEGASSRARVELVVLAAITLLVAFHAWSVYRPYSFLHGDGSFYATINRSLAEGTLNQERFQPMSWYRTELRWNYDLDAGWSNVALGADGRSVWPKHPILLPLLHMPLFHAFGLDGLLYGSVLMTSLSLWFAFRIAARLTSQPAAALAALTWATFPLLQHGAYSYSNDVLYGMLSLAAIDATQRRRGLTAGLLWGLALVSKPTLALLAAPFVAELVVARQWSVIGRIVAGAAGPLAALGVANTVMFGSPLTQGYQRIGVRQHGVLVPFDIREKFHRAWRDGIKAILDDQHEGLRVRVMPAVRALVGLVPLALTRDGRVFGLAFVASLALTAAFYARFEYTYARFFTPWVLLAVVPAAAVIQTGIALLARLRPRLPPRVRAVLEDPRWFPLLAGLLVARAAVRTAPAFGQDVAGWSVALPLLREEAWALLGAAMDRARAFFTPRRALASGVFAALCVAVVPPVVARANRGPYRWRSDAALPTARVQIEPPFAPPVPCDYLNPARGKWECTDWEQGDWTSWGRALGDECGFANDTGHWIWLHPNPNVVRTITWPSLPAGELHLRFGAAPLSQTPDVSAEVRSGDARRTIRPQRVGVVEELVIPAGERGPTLTISVPVQPHDWRQLCVEAWIR